MPSPIKTPLESAKTEVAPFTSWTAVTNLFQGVDEKREEKARKAEPVKFTPLPGPQMMCYESEADVIGFGGQAGGGKTGVAVGMALTKHHKTCIYRRESTQMREIIDITEAFIGNRDGFNENKGLWRNIPGGKTIEFGGVAEEGDENKWKGRTHDLKCVGKGTPVRMADGSYKNVEEVRVGDCVATLEGPKPVTRVLPVQQKDSVEASFYLEGKLVWRQVQAANHEVLTKAGWVSHDKMAEPSRRAFSFSILRRCVCRFLKAFALKSVLFSEHRVRSLLGQPHVLRQVQRLPHLRFLQGFFFGAEVSSQGIGCVGFAGLSLNVLQRSLLTALRARRLPFPMSNGLCAQPHFCGHGKQDAPSDPLLVSSQGGCSCGTRQCGEPPRLCGVDALIYPQPQADVGQPSPMSFEGYGRGKTPRHSLPITAYFHPYTRESRRTQTELVSSQVSYRFLGKRDLYDLTVQSANHYITSEFGIINKNCFDEATEFREATIRFLMAWNRTTHKVNGKPQKCTTLLCFNPPTTVEGEWVISFFAPWLDPDHPNPAQDGELRWYAMIDGEEKEVPSGQPFVIEKGVPVYEFDAAQIPVDLIQYPKSRTFIRASVRQNPYLTSGDYIRQLQALPEPLRSQMLEGKFNMGRDENPWQLIPSAYMNEAQKRWRKELPDDARLVSFGLDVAHGGKDNTVLTALYEGTRTVGGVTYKVLHWREPIAWPGVVTKDGETVKALVVPHYVTGSVINVDSVGYGASAYDELKKMNEEGQPPIVFGVNNGQPHPKDPNKRDRQGKSLPASDRSGKFTFVNVRAQMAWKLRELMDDRSDVKVELPPSKELRSDLCTPTYRLQAGKYYVESKEDVKKRLPDRRSTDYGDSAILAVANLGPGKVKRKARSWSV